MIPMLIWTDKCHVKQLKPFTCKAWLNDVFTTSVNSPLL